MIPGTIYYYKISSLAYNREIESTYSSYNSGYAEVTTINPALIGTWNATSRYDDYDGSWEPYYNGDKLIIFSDGFYTFYECPRLIFRASNIVECLEPLVMSTGQLTNDSMQVDNYDVSLNNSMLILSNYNYSDQIMFSKE
ncbi:hypothetical protein ACFL0B_10075 [Thermodesulfobacteriota bacterium]